MVASAVKLLRAASIVICLIVVASFAVFAVDQTKNASAAQTEELNNGTTGPVRPATGTTGQSGVSPQKRTGKHENGVHEALDETSDALTSPFSGVVSSSDSEWVTRGVRMVLALLVYGFGLGYLARVLRVRT